METQLSKLPRKDTLTGEEILPALDLSTGDSIQIKVSDIGGNANVDYDLVANIVANNISGTIQVAVDAANTAGFYANIAVSAANSANGYAIASFDSATNAAAFANDSLQYSIVSESSSLVSRIVAGNLFPFDFKDDSRYWSVVSNPALQFANPVTGTFPVVSGKGKVFQKTHPRASVNYTIYSTGTETLIPNRIYNLKASYRYIGGDGTYDVKAIVVGLNAAGDTVVYSEETLISGNTNGLTWLDINLDIDSDTFLSNGAVSIKPALQLFVNSGTIDPTFQVHTIIFRDTTESSLSSDFLDATITYRNQAETFANSSFQSANASSTFALQAQLFRDQANTSAIAAFNSQVTANTHANSAGTFASAAQSSSLSAAVSANTANTQAVIATSAAVSANSSASAANTSAGISATFAGQANTSAIAANTSANTAAAQATIATAQANVATSAAVSANSSAASANTSASISATFATESAAKSSPALNYNPFFEQGKTLWYTGHGAETGTPAGLVGTVGGRPTVLYDFSVYFPFYSNIFPIQAGAKYEITADIFSGNAASRHYLGVVPLDANKASLTGGSALYFVLSNATLPIVGWNSVSAIQDISAAYPTAKYAQVICLLNYNGQTGDSGADFIQIKEVTSRETSIAQANIATAAAVSANSSSASAASSAVLSASIGLNSLNKNPTFAAWPVGNAFPDDWSNWATGTGTRTRVAGDLGGFAVQETPGSSSADMGFACGPAGMVGLKGAGWYVMEAEVTLVSGVLTGAAMYASTASESFSFAFSNKIDPVTDAPYGNGTVGRRYKFSHLFEKPNSETNWTLIAMTNWTGYTTASKTLKWHRASIRDASPQEIRDQTVLEPLEATVISQGSAIANVTSRTATYLNRVSAGTGVAEVELVALDSANVATSAINIRADKISLGSLSNAALSIANGNATFTGELNVGTGTGARVNITQNLIQVFDANNVLRVRLGIW